MITRNLFAVFFIVSFIALLVFFYLTAVSSGIDKEIYFADSLASAIISSFCAIAMILNSEFDEDSN